MNTQSREVNSIRNFTVGVSYQVIILFLNLIAKTVFIKVLGTAFLGINGLFTNLFIILSFAELGIAPVMLYAFYEPIIHNDRQKISAIYRFFERIYFIIGGISALLGIMIIPILGLLVNTDVAIPHLEIYYVLYLVGIVINNLYGYRSNLIIADQKKYIIGLYQFLFEGIALILQIAFLLYTRNYSLYLIIVLIKNIGFNYIISKKLYKLYPFLKDRSNAIQLDDEERLKILDNIKDIIGYRLAKTMLVGTDNILISILVGTIYVGYYSNYDLIVAGVISLVKTFYSGISASIGNLIAKETIEDQYKVFNMTKVLGYWICGFTTTCLYILFQDFITLWLGEALLLEWPVMAVIVLNYYLVCNRNAIKVFRHSAGIFDRVKYVMGIAAIINILLSILLGRLFGIIGVLGATSITALTTYYWYEAKILMERKFNRSLSGYLTSEIKGVLLTLISIGLTSMAVGFINEVSIGGFILKIIICIIVPNLFYFVVLRNDEAIKAVYGIAMRTYKRIMSR